MYFRKRIFDLYKNNAFAFYLGTTWFVLINSSFFFCIKYLKNLENRHPYISDAIHIFKLSQDYSNQDNLKLINKKGTIDSSNKIAKCELTLLYNDEKVYLDVNAINVKEATNNKNGEPMDSDNEEEEGSNEENRDISLYIENPYLIKRELKIFLSSVKKFIQSFISGDDKEENEKVKEFTVQNQMIEETIENAIHEKSVKNKEKEILKIINSEKQWRINNILLVKRKLGNPKDSLIIKTNSPFLNFLSKRVNHWYEIKAIYGNPEDNSYFYKYEKKKELNKIQANIIKVLLAAFLGSSCLVVRRIIIYKNAYSALNFVKRFVYNNKHLHNLLSNDEIQILSISGEHQKNYVNSKVFLQANEKQGVVHITATKNRNDRDFCLLHAKLLFGNQTVELKTLKEN